ncbi:MAG: glutamine--tRNA ligase/YqeY domain fusion protein [Bacteroidota bacterium]
MTPRPADPPPGPPSADGPVGGRPHFIREIIEEDMRTGRCGGLVHTRFPPEPNGYLHIGHAKSICLNFGLARDYGGLCNLRFDDTNPVKEELEYVRSIQRDVRWLGFDWGDRLMYASDYFGRLYELAEGLTRKGKAYVCDLTADEIREYRGTLTTPGRNSPFRERSASENVDLFRRMRAGEFPDGSRTLRAKIDMSSPNLNLRDPVMYRILRAVHHRTGDAWCIYPMYDWAHGQSDALEGITHSICTLEFADHKPLYDWFLGELDIGSPRQIEFARLNLTYTVMSKRRLLQLVQEGVVRGWDDPRMPTISGLRRRGYTPASIRMFAERVGVARNESTSDVALLEDCVRDDLNRHALRAMAVLRPLKLVVENFPEGVVEELEAVNNPEDPSAGMRRVPFSRELLIEEEDFRENPPPKYFRLSPGAEVRLRYAYIVRCTGVRRDPSTGAVTEVLCTYDPASRSGGGEASRRVRGTIHWVSGRHAREAEVRLYDRLFSVETPGGEDWKRLVHPASLQILRGCRVEPALGAARSQDRFQFERLGYFCVDDDSSADLPVFNRTVTLRDTWARIQRSSAPQ